MMIKDSNPWGHLLPSVTIQGVMTVSEQTDEKQQENFKVQKCHPFLEQAALLSA